MNDFQLNHVNQTTVESLKSMIFDADIFDIQDEALAASSTLKAGLVRRQLEEQIELKQLQFDLTDYFWDEE